MPFTDADGSPITCHTCPFKINTDCTAMPPTPSTNALTMQVWNYPPARNPCVRHPALGGMPSCRRALRRCCNLRLTTYRKTSPRNRLTFSLERTWRLPA